MAVVINDFELVPPSPEAPQQSRGTDSQASQTDKREVQKSVSRWIHKQKERSLRNWAH